MRARRALSREVAEDALAHVVANTAEADYQRGDLLQGVVFALQSPQLLALVTAGQEEQRGPEQHQAHAERDSIAVGIGLLLARNLGHMSIHPQQLAVDLLAVVSLILQRR